MKQAAPLGGLRAETTAHVENAPAAAPCACARSVPSAQPLMAHCGDRATARGAPADGASPTAPSRESSCKGAGVHREIVITAGTPIMHNKTHALQTVNEKETHSKQAAIITVARLHVMWRIEARIMGLLSDVP